MRIARLRGRRMNTAQIVTASPERRGLVDATRPWRIIVGSRVKNRQDRRQAASLRREPLTRPRGAPGGRLARLSGQRKMRDSPPGVHVPLTCRIDLNQFAHHVKVYIRLHLRWRWGGDRGLEVQLQCLAEICESLPHAFYPGLTPLPPRPGDEPLAVTPDIRLGLSLGYLHRRMTRVMAPRFLAASPSNHTRNPLLPAGTAV